MSELVPGKGKHRKERIGRVVSAKGQKTAIVVVERRIRHPLYKKYVTVRKRFAAHDEVGCAVGDRVQIREGRPISKTKRWHVLQRLGQDGTPLPRDG